MKRSIFYILLVVLISACQPMDIPNPGDKQHIAQVDQSFATELPALWEAINQSYVFWDIDTTDWDARYMRFQQVGADLERRRLEAHGSFRFSDEDKQLLASLFDGLLDHHLAVAIVNPDLQYGQTGYATSVSPGKTEVKKRTGYHRAFSVAEYVPALKSMAKQKTISVDSLLSASTPYVSGWGVMQVSSCLIDSGIPYLHMSSYNINAYLNQGNATTRRAVENFFSQIKRLKKSGKLKGVILDNRGNGGGYLSDLTYVLGLFISDRKTVMLTRTKSGLGKYDYGEWITQYITPNEESNYYVGELDVPYVVLLDCYSISCAEMSASAISALPTGYIIGERSFGGHGVLMTTNTYEQNIYNGPINCGPEDTAGHMVYTTNSCCRIYNAHSKQYEILEGKGILPQLEVALDTMALKQKTADNQLLTAVRYIRQPNAAAK